MTTVQPLVLLKIAGVLLIMSTDASSDVLQYGDEIALQFIPDASANDTAAVTGRRAHGCVEPWTAKSLPCPAPALAPPPPP